MPTYDFRCSGCKKKFSLTMGIAERSRKRIKCPKCASQKVEPVFSMFFCQDLAQGLTARVSRASVAERPAE